MSRLVLIGGPPGVGKSSVASALLRRIDDCAWLDGDDLWRTHPFDPSESRKRMVEANISFVLRSFLRERIGTVLFSWVLHRRDLIDRLVESLADLDFEMHAFTLLCSEAALRERFASDPARSAPDAQAFERLRQCSQLSGVTRIDTTDTSLDRVVEQVLAAL